jgi:cytochrome c peroxidase
VAAQSDEVGSTSKYSDGDDGRIPATVPKGAEGAFKTPSLRCVADRPTLMHTGLVRSLDEAVAFFDRGGGTSDYPGTKEIAPLGLSPDDRRDLVEFLNVLGRTRK